MSWKSYGACIDSGVDFFPDSVAGRTPVQAAKKVCAGCFVRAQCLDYALRNHELGIWGGTTTNERQRIQERYVRDQALDRAPWSLGI
jgi:WhiB family transcriptional regulator, redox-sensing transcriptional regulator